MVLEQKEKQNTAERPEINLNIYGQLISDKGIKKAQ